METVIISRDEKNHTLNLTLSGRLDSMTAPEVSHKLELVLDKFQDDSCVVDVEKLGYISSAGLRVLIDLKKRCANMRVINVSLDIYDIFAMTGFTKFITVERRIRKVRHPAPGQLISEDGDSKLYRSTNDLAVRVFNPGLPFEEIQKRFQLSKIATSYGIPTPIAFEIVSCDDNYGIIYEIVNGQTLSEIFDQRPNDMQEETKQLAELMHMVHQQVVEKKELPDFGSRMLEETENNTQLSAEQKSDLKCLVSSLNATDTFIYGNLRLSKVLVCDGRLLFTDLTRCGRGNPLLDLQAAASAMNADGHGEFWKKFFARYTQDFADDKKQLLQRILRPSIRPWWKA